MCKIVYTVYVVLVSRYSNIFAMKLWVYHLLIVLLMLICKCCAPS